jgi:hypothetical protein
MALKAADWAEAEEMWLSGGQAARLQAEERLQDMSGHM